MRLNEEGIKKLRAQLEIELANVKEDHSVVLPPELLERLIFGKTPLFIRRDVVYPVWCGPFLRKLDLSKLSFDGVCLDYGMILEKIVSEEVEKQMEKEQEERKQREQREKEQRERINHNRAMFEDDDFEEEQRLRDNSWPVFKYYEKQKRVEQIIKDTPRLDFSGTNIKIDFSKLERASISKINLSGVDLRCSNLNGLLEIVDCDISNTRIILPFGNPRFVLKDSNCTQNDFSYLQIDESVFYRKTNLTHPNIVNCDFSGTGLSLVYSMSKKRINEIIYKNHSEEVRRFRINNPRASLSDEPKSITVEYDRLGREIKAGHFGGCYINGKLMPTKEQSQANKERNQEVVANFEQEETEKILSLVRQYIVPEE